MKLSSCIVLRPIYFLVFLMFVVLSLAGAMVPLWISRVKRIENEVKSMAYHIHQELVFGVEETSTLFSPFNASAINLVRILSSSVHGNELQFSSIASQVASALFQALSTIPYLSQISYIRSDGLMFAYYTKENQLFGLYSNCTYDISQNYTWYVQPANRDTGKLYGEAIKSPQPYNMFNSSWFLGALNSTKGYVSAGVGWDIDSEDILLISTAGMNGRAAISLGFPMKFIVDFLTSVDFYSGSLYLATKDGNVIVDQEIIPNTRLILDRDRVSFQLIGFDGYDRVGEVIGKVTCHPHYDISNEENILSIWKKKYVINCSPVEFAGLELVYVLALPHNELTSGVMIDKNIKLAFTLLMVMVVAMVITVCTFVYSSVGGARREMYLCGALIKQMEATQQAERKSMNKSLAFASASHDVRASLAGITGLIEMCRSELSSKRDSSRSELQTNLSQMEGCTRDLLGILNTILDTSKIEAGKMQLEEEEFDIERTLEDVVNLFYPVGMKKHIDIILDPYDGSLKKYCRVVGDRAKLRQILCNLLSNAVKYTPEGYVTIRAWARKPSPIESEIIAASSHQHNSVRCLFCLFFKFDKAYNESSSSEVGNRIHQRDPNCMEFLFEVNDTGKGIPKDKHKSIFENYVQVKETSLGQEGTGLGLGIVQSLVRLMGGDIEIVDKEIGEKGTCFRFNVFFSACDTNCCSTTRETDIEANGDIIISSDHHSFHHRSVHMPTVRSTLNSPKTEGSQVLLFMQSSKRSNVLQHFMRRHGIKVQVVEHHEQLSSTLQKIKKKLSLSRQHSSSSTTRSDVNSRINGISSSRVSSLRSKEMLLSFSDGVDHCALSSQKRLDSHSIYVLIVIDTRAGTFRDISRAVAEFRRDLNDKCCCHVIWLDKQGVDGVNFFGLDEDKLPESDFIMSKPFHGSRFYQAIGLLPEFGRKGEITHQNLDRYSMNSEVEARNSGIDTGKSENTNVKVITGTESYTKSKGEIQEILEGRLPLTGKRILVADDDHVSQMITRNVASQLGAKINVCGNGKEAWELVRQSLIANLSIEPLKESSLPFDYILMDCMMPEMDGFEATKRIREEEANFGIRIPIIALTAHQWGEEISLMIQAGADGYLTKPAKKENLLKVLSELNKNA